MNILYESMPLAGVMPVVGITAPRTLFITQYTKPNSFMDNPGHPEYGLSGDIFSSNILTKDKITGALKLMESADELTDANVRIYKYIGENTDEVFDKITEAYLYGDIVSDNFIYETITGKNLLCDDQLECDELLEEVNPYNIKDKLSVECYSLREQFYDIINKDRLNVPIMNSKELYEADNLLEGHNEISIYDSIKGYYALNEHTGMRTGYYKTISEIPVKLIY